MLAVGGGFSLGALTSKPAAPTPSSAQASKTTLDPTTTNLRSTASGACQGPTTRRSDMAGADLHRGCNAGCPEGAVTNGRIIFYSQNGGTEPTVLGAAPLKTAAGVSKASLTVAGFTPGLSGMSSPDIVGAYYVGDSKTIGSSSEGLYQYVQPAPTTVQARAVAGGSHQVVLTATLVPRTMRRLPGGRVVFLADGGTSFLGSAPVTTIAGTTTATVLALAPPAASGPITARYTGDMNYSGATSPPVAVGVVRSKSSKSSKS